MISYCKKGPFFEIPNPRRQVNYCNSYACCETEWAAGDKVRYRATENQGWGYGIITATEPTLKYRGKSTPKSDLLGHVNDASVWRVFEKMEVWICAFCSVCKSLSVSNSDEAGLRVFEIIVFF